MPRSVFGDLHLDKHGKLSGYSVIRGLARDAALFGKRKRVSVMASSKPERGSGWCGLMVPGIPSECSCWR